MYKVRCGLRLANKKGTIKMYNQKLTSGTFDGNLTVARGHKLITDADGKALGTLSKKHICDLNGKEIATYVSTEKSVSAEGKTVKKRRFQPQIIAYKKF